MSINPNTTAGSFVGFAGRPETQQHTNGLSATSGTLTFTGGSLASQATTNTIGYNYWPYQTGYSYPVYYPAHNESRVVALEAEVKVLREMLAAVLSGRDLPKAAKAKR